MGICTCVQGQGFSATDSEGNRKDYSYLGLNDDWRPEVYVSLGYPAGDAYASASVDIYDESHVRQEKIWARRRARREATNERQGSAMSSAVRAMRAEGRVPNAGPGREPTCSSVASWDSTYAKSWDSRAPLIWEHGVFAA